MKKQLLLLSLFLLSACTVLVAQKEKSTIYKTEIGINVTDLLVRTTGNQTGLVSANFPFTIKRKMSNKSYIRFGFGVDFSTSENSFTVSEDLIQWAARIGLEKRVNISPRFLLLYGLDVMVLSFEERLRNDAVEIVTKNFSYGAGPVLGLQFKINDRLALEIESNLYSWVHESSRETIFGSLPGSSTKENERRFSSALNLPQWLHFVVKF